MNSRFERSVHLFYFDTATYPKTAPDIKLLNALKMIQARWSEGKHIAFVSDTGVIQRTKASEGAGLDKVAVDVRNAVYLADFKIDEQKGYARLLVTRGDPDAPHAAFVTPTKNAVRHERPSEGEAPGCSAHVVISLTTRKVTQDWVRVALEQVPLASKTYVLNYINWLLRTAAEDDPTMTYDPPKQSKGASPISKPYRPLLHHHDRPSSTLRRDIQQGHVSAIQLVRSQTFDLGQDVSYLIKSTDHVVKIGVKGGAAKEAVETLLTRVFAKKVSDEFSEVVVTLRGLPGNKSRSVRFDNELENAMDIMYTRTEIVEFSDEIDQCHSSFDMRVIKALEGLVSNDANWKN